MNAKERKGTESRDGRQANELLADRKEDARRPYERLTGYLDRRLQKISRENSRAVHILGKVKIRPVGTGT